MPLNKTLYKEPNYKCWLGETQIIAQGKQTKRDKRTKRRTINKELGWVSLLQKFWYVFSCFWMLIHLALWGTTNEPNVLKFVGFDLNISCWYGKADSYIWARRANEPFICNPFIYIHSIWRTLLRPPVRTKKQVRLQNLKIKFKTFPKNDEGRGEQQ